MAYETEDLKEQANKALDMPKYEAFDSLIDIHGAKKIFSDKKESELAFTDSIQSSIAPMLESVYFDDIKRVYREYWFKYRKQGLFNFRADLYAEGDKQNYLIEVKNPTHTLRESIGGISQLMMYNIALSKFKKDFKLIYISSVIEPMVIEFIKQYNVDIEAFFMNGKQTAHWANI